MIELLRALTFAFLLGWPAYNIVIAIIALRRARPTRRTVDHLHDFWIMIPALDEERVIERTVRSALALDTPSTPVRVLVVDDGSTDATPRILASIRDRRLHVLRRDPPHARQGKGEALNAGYRLIRSVVARQGREDATVLGVIDGDGRGDGALLETVSDLMADPQVGAVQCRVRINNRHRILGMLQDIEFACVANASQILRDRLGSVGMGGNGQFVRLAALARLGDSPWSSCLVEDLELGLRLHLTGTRIRYASAASTSQQAVVEPMKLLRQRTRWAQGNLQCVRYVHPLSASRHVSSLGLLDFLCYLAAPWLTVPMTVLVLGAMALAVIGLTTGDTFGGLMAGRAGAEWAIGLWAGALVVPGLLWGLVHWWRIGDERLRRCVLAGLCYPAFLVLGVLATWRAAARHAVRRNAWTKTERLAEPVAEVPRGLVPQPRTPHTPDRERRPVDVVE